MTIFVVVQCQDSYWSDWMPVAYSTVLLRAVTLAKDLPHNEVLIHEFPLGELNPAPLNTYSATGEKK